jgi:long-chain acyl-CoA synthetase
MTANFHPEQLGTLYGLFQARVAAAPERTAYRQYDTATETWQSYSWAQIAAEVARWQAALAGEGLAPGERVAVMLKNCVEWVIFDQAALGLGLVTVPLYLDDRPESGAYILKHSGAKLLLIEGRFQHKKIADMTGSVATLERIVSLTRPDAEPADPRLAVAADWLAAAGAPPPLPALDADQLASIIYTSGTTGRPKGVMLTHANMLWNAYYATQCVALDERDVFLSFLPLSHTLERTAGYYWPMLIGAEVAYARSVAQLAQDMQTLRPTVLISVPRLRARLRAYPGRAGKEKSAGARAVQSGGAGRLAALRAALRPRTLASRTAVVAAARSPGRAQRPRQTWRQARRGDFRRRGAVARDRAHLHRPRRADLPGLRPDRNQPGGVRQPPVVERAGRHRPADAGNRRENRRARRAADA